MAITPGSSLVPQPSGFLEPAVSAPQRLVEAFLSGRSPRTLLAYSGDLDNFASWSGASSASEACGQHRKLGGG